MKKYSDKYLVETPDGKYKFHFCPKKLVFNWVTKWIPKHQREQHEIKFLKRYKKDRIL